MLEQGSYARAASAEAGSATAARAAVASSDGEYRRLWRELIAQSDPPAIDFSAESVVFLLLGQKSTGGWGIEVEAVETSGTEAAVRSNIVRPEPGGIVTMAFTAPFAVVAVREPGLRSARWVDENGSVVARSGEGAN